MVFGRSERASGVPGNFTAAIGVRAWNKFAESRKGAVSDIDRSVRAVVSGSEVSLDQSSESSRVSPHVDLPSRTGGH